MRALTNPRSHSPELPRLPGDLVERVVPDSLILRRCRRFDRPRLFQPTNKVIPVAQPLDPRPTAWRWC